MEMVVVGNVTFTDQIMDEVQTAAEAGADELIVDLNRQDRGDRERVAA
jgi:hypothetical protein